MMGLSYGIYDLTTGTTHRYDVTFYDLDNEQWYTHNIECPNSQLYTLLKQLYYHHALPSYYEALNGDVIIDSTLKRTSFLDVNLMFSDLYTRIFHLKQYTIEEFILELVQATTNFYVYKISR